MAARISLNHGTNGSSDLFARAVRAAANRHKTPHINISFSLISMYKACPRQVLYRLVLPEVPQNQAPFIGGSVSHKLIEKWATEMDYAPGWMSAVYEDFYAEFESKQEILVYRPTIGAQPQNEWGCATDREFQLEKVRRCVEGFEQIAMELQLREHGAQYERWITRHVRDIFYIKGSVDIYDYVTRNIYDIKSSTSSSYGDTLQLKFYALLVTMVDKTLPAMSQFLLPILENPYRQQVKPTAETNREVLTEVSVIMDKISAGVFPTTPGRACHTCAYKSYCPIYGGKFDPEEHI